MMPTSQAFSSPLPEYRRAPKGQDTPTALHSTLRGDLARLRGEEAALVLRNYFNSSSTGIKETFDRCDRNGDKSLDAPEVIGVLCLQADPAVTLKEAELCVAGGRAFGKAGLRY